MLKLDSFKGAGIVVLFILLFNNLFAQTNVYKPFPETTGRWIVQYECCYDPGGGGGTQIQDTWTLCETSGDTTIGTYTYKNVTSANSTGYPSFPGGIPFGPSHYLFSYRNDIPAKQVYIYTNISGQYKDTLWYDFNLNVGDTLLNTFAFKNQNSSYNNDRRLVSSIDSVLICNTYYKRYNFCGSAGGGGFRVELIEGVGFGDNFVKTDFPICPFEPYQLYSTNFSCSLTAVPEKTEIFREDQFQISPNPVKDQLQINFSSHLLFPFEYSIFDVFGKLVVEGNGITDNRIDVLKLNNGLFFLRIKDKNDHYIQRKFVKQ